MRRYCGGRGFGVADMSWKELAPYLIPALVMVLLARRVMKTQQPSAVRLWRLWILPGALLAITGLTLAHEPIPGVLAIGAFVLAAAAGAALGWFRVHTLEFTVDPETGTIFSKSTPVGAIILVALLMFRYAIKSVLTGEGVRGVELVRWTDGALIFTAAMLVAQSAHTWVRARRLLPLPGPVRQSAESSGSPE
jgi:membrane protein CcdC involved in cytochrome C biogenesis